jgi:hypothetical protein
MPLSFAAFAAGIKSSIFFHVVTASPHELDVRSNVAGLVRGALLGTGLNLVASCGIEAYDAAAPEAFRSSAWLAGARGLVVVGSAGPELWRRLREDGRYKLDAPSTGGAEVDANPLDRFVSDLLQRGDAVLAGAGIAFRRFEAAFHASPRVDFLALGRLVGLGRPGPFGILIHPVHGPWWALRGAWLVDAPVDAAVEPARPCDGCAAPCVGGWSHSGGVGLATPEARARCVVGQASRYDEDQIAYHKSIH